MGADFNHGSSFFARDSGVEAAQCKSVGMQIIQICSFLSVWQCQTIFESNQLYFIFHLVATSVVNTNPISLPNQTNSKANLNPFVTEFQRTKPYPHFNIAYISPVKILLNERQTRAPHEPFCKKCIKIDYLILRGDSKG